jgi:hypothetical protein
MLIQSGRWGAFPSLRSAYGARNPSFMDQFRLPAHSAAQVRTGGGFAGRMRQANVLLLKAALLDGDAALAAYRAWRATLDLNTISIGEQRLLPLLHRNLTRLGVSDPLSDRFRGVRRFYWVNNRKRMIFARRVFETFASAGVPFIALKGLSLAACYLEDPSVRPMNDVDILVTDENVAEAAAILGEMQLLPQNLPVEYVVKSDRLRSFTPGWAFGRGESAIDLHWRALHFDGRPRADEEFWSAAREATLDCTTFLVFDPADQLLHICAHAAQPGRAEAANTWPADAALIIKNSSDLSFERVVAGAARHGISAIMADALRFVASELELPVSLSAIASLEKAATWSERTEMRLADRPYSSSAAPTRLFLDFQAFRRSNQNTADGLISALAEFPKRTMGAAGTWVGLILAIKDGLGNPAWLRGLLGRDRYRTVPQLDHLPKVGEQLNFQELSFDESPLISGWSILEPTGRWTTGREAVLAWSVRGEEDELELCLDGHAFLHEKAPTKLVELWIDGKKITQWQFRLDAANPFPARVAIPRRLVRDRDVLMLTFVIQSPCSPAEVGESADPRPLGILLRSMSLDRAALLDPARGIVVSSTPPEHRLEYGRYRVIPALDRLPQVGDCLSLGGASIDETALLAGWSHAEPTGRWTVGREATIAWSVRGNQSELELLLDGHAFLHKKAPMRSIKLWVSDWPAVQWRFKLDGLSPLPARIAIPSAVVRDRDVIFIRFEVQSPCSPAEVGESSDARALGLHLRSIMLTKPRNSGPNDKL